MIVDLELQRLYDRVRLVRGKGDRRSGTLCIMTFVALLAGERHTDAPSTASPVLRALAHGTRGGGVAVGRPCAGNRHRHDRSCGRSPGATHATDGRRSSAGRNRPADCAGGLIGQESARQAKRGQHLSATASRCAAHAG